MNLIEQCPKYGKNERALAAFVKILHLLFSSMNHIILARAVTLNLRIFSLPNMMLPSLQITVWFEKFLDDEEGNLIARDGATGTSASGGHFSNLWSSAQKRAGRSWTRVKDRFQGGRGATGLPPPDLAWAGFDSLPRTRGREREEENERKRTRGREREEGDRTN